MSKWWSLGLTVCACRLHTHS